MHLWFIASCSLEVLFVGNVISIELNDSCLWELSCAMSGDWQHPCLYLLKTSSTPSVVTTTNVYRHCQMILGGANLPLIESHAIVCFLLAHKLMAWLKVDWISELVKYHSCFKVSLHILILLRFSVFSFFCSLLSLYLRCPSNPQIFTCSKSRGPEGQAKMYIFFSGASSKSNMNQLSESRDHIFLVYCYIGTQ